MTHHYNASVLDNKSVFNTITGRENIVNVSLTNTGFIELNGTQVEAHQYRYSGDLEGTTVWYDSEGRMLQMHFPSNDGTIIQLRCTRCGL